MAEERLRYEVEDSLTATLQAVTELIAERDAVRVEVERLHEGLADAIAVVENVAAAWRHLVLDSEGDQLLHRKLLDATDDAAESLRRFNGTAWPPAGDLGTVGQKGAAT